MHGVPIDRYILNILADIRVPSFTCTANTKHTLQPPINSNMWEYDECRETIEFTRPLAMKANTWLMYLALDDKQLRVNMYVFGCYNGSFMNMRERKREIENPLSRAPWKNRLDWKYAMKTNQWTKCLPNTAWNKSKYSKLYIVIKYLRICTIISNIFEQTFDARRVDFKIHVSILYT